ncbi:hypothetical protein A3D23_02815 [candidate division WOR-1 bacterium RIFCSPHIGHO2_02_FULL_53_26]|nr:MAG: hypothetical protein A3D23_02815 [candidate division WOR-1 bacterium RIFCSPHIGHO2_02_FULL_53_26]
MTIIGTGPRGPMRLYPIEAAARRMTGDGGKLIRLIATPAHLPMARKVVSRLDIPLSPVRYLKQVNGLWRAELLAPVRGADLFIIHTANTGRINENMMQLYALLTAISKLPPKERPARVVASCLHLPYARQERKAEPREPISAAAMADLITKVHYPDVSGLGTNILIRVDSRRVVTRVIVVTLHSAAVEGFFPVPVDHLDGRPLMVRFINSHMFDPDKTIITGPDAGRFKLSLKIAGEIFGDEAQKHLINIAKGRDKKDARGKSKVESIVVGDVAGKDIFIIDDMIDTGGTIEEAVKALKRAGAGKIYVVTIHGILSGPAIERLASVEGIEKIGVVDTLDISTEKLKPLGGKVVRLSFADYLVHVIQNTFQEQSIIGYQSLT